MRQRPERRRIHALNPCTRVTPGANAFRLPYKRKALRIASLLAGGGVNRFGERAVADIDGDR
jgi:hypothetical protein